MHEDVSPCVVFFILAELTFLRLFEAIVLGQPLGVRHKHVVFELRVLLHQQERLADGQVKGRGGWGWGERARGRRCDEDLLKKDNVPGT